MPLRALQVGDVETARCEHLSRLARPAADDLVAKDTWRCVLQLSLSERWKPVIAPHMTKHGTLSIIEYGASRQLAFRTPLGSPYTRVPARPYRTAPEGEQRYRRRSKSAATN